MQQAQVKDVQKELNENVPWIEANKKQKQEAADK